MNNLTYLSVHLMNIMFVVTRVGTFFIAAPFFGSKIIPIMLRIFISIAIGCFLYASPKIVPIYEVPSLFKMFMIFLSEVTIGLILTFIAQMIYLPLQVMGILVGLQAGLGQGNIINPDYEDQNTDLEQFLYIFGILLFFSFNGHHMLLRVIVVTYEFLPTGGLLLSGKIVKVVVDFFTKTFHLGVSLAAPIIGILLLVTICFGILSKSMPQMNLLILELPLRIMVALFGILLAMPIIVAIFEKYLMNTNKTFEALIYLMQKG